jgi:hypothetical protein
LVDNFTDLLYNRHILKHKEQDMGYKVLADKTEMDLMRVKYGPRKGLEGPFNFMGRVLYYDPKEGSYYDPTTDFYVAQAEMDSLNHNLMNLLQKA